MIRQPDPFIEHVETLADQSVENLRRKFQKRLYRKEQVEGWPHQTNLVKCQHCGSTRLGAAQFARVVDECHTPLAFALGIDYSLGPGSEHDLPFRFCFNCGMIQGTWPLPPLSGEKP